MLYVRRNQMGGKFFATKAKLCSRIIHIPNVRSSAPSDKLPKCLSPLFVQIVIV